MRKSIQIFAKQCTVQETDADDVLLYKVGQGTKNKSQ